MRNQGGRVRLWLNDGEGRFDDVTDARMPRTRVEFSWDLELVDVDNDWDLDVATSCKMCPTSRLYLNDGTGSFEDVSEKRMPASTNNYDFAPLDLDGDGYLDLLTVNDGDTTAQGAAERAFRNDGRGGFVDATDEWTPSDALQTPPPHVPHPAVPVSIETAKEAKRRQRPPARPSRALLDVRRAAQELAEAGHATFVTAQLRDRLAAAGCGWKPSTVSDLLDQEATWRPDALIERVSYDKYRLRDRPGQQVDAVASGATARTHVLETLRRLHEQAPADGDRGEGFSAAQVHQHLAAAGVRYNRAHLSRVLKQLTQEGVPAVVRVDRFRFRLTG